MSDFTKNRFVDKAGADAPETETVVGRVENITSSPQTGMQRLIVRETKGVRKQVAIDIPSKQVSDIKRKGTYKFEAEQKGGAQKEGGQTVCFSSNHMKTYFTDRTPEVSDGSSADGRWGRFGGSGRGGGGTGRRF